jgi:hypothetical protein
MLAPARGCPPDRDPMVNAYAGPNAVDTAARKWNCASPRYDFRCSTKPSHTCTDESTRADLSPSPFRATTFSLILSSLLNLTRHFFLSFISRYRVSRSATLCRVNSEEVSDTHSRTFSPATVSVWLWLAKKVIFDMLTFPILSE